MAQNEVNQYNEADETNVDITGTPVAPNQMYPYHVDDAFRKLMGALARLIGSASIVAAGTTNLGSLPGEKITVTGNTAITSFGTIKAGTVKFINFTGTPTLTYNATSLILPTAANIVVAAGDTAVFVSEGSGNWRCMSYQRASGSSVQPAFKGYISGLTISNNATDAVNDIDIAAGECASDAATPTLMALAATLTKRLDAAWSVGSGNGGLDTGAIANSTYHVWLIQRSDTGVVDALFSLSATAPTMPANYDRKRRVGSIFRLSNAIRLFTQVNDDFFIEPVLNEATTAPGITARSISLSTPSGIVTEAIVSGATFQPSGVGDCPVLYTPLALPNSTPLVAGPFSYIVFGATGTPTGGGGEFRVATDLNSSIRVRLGSSVASTVHYITTRGWSDRRGR